MAGANDDGICGFLWLTCSQLVSCAPPNNVCYQPDHACVRHSRCFSHPICYPLSMAEQICPPESTPPSPVRPGDGICANARWAQNATTVAGGNGWEPELNQLDVSWGLFVDDEQSVYVTDLYNSRVVKWKSDVSSGQVVADERGGGHGTDKFYEPIGIVIDKDGVMFISDSANRRVQKWPRNAQRGETIIEDIDVTGIGLDDQGSLYASDSEKGEVRKWRLGETIGQLITSELYNPHFLFVDRTRSVFVADTYNLRVIKVKSERTQISITAGGSQGEDADQLSNPFSVIVDQLGAVYVSDTENHRIMRWPHGAKSGSVAVGGWGKGSRSDQLDSPHDLSFDLDGNLYVVDTYNNRVQKFLIDKSLF